MDQSKRISDLKARRAALSARLASAEAQQAKEERKALTRKRIVIGAAVQRACAAGRMTPDGFRRLLTENLAIKDLELFKF